KVCRLEVKIRFDVAELGIRARRIDAGNAALAPSVSVIGRHAKTIAKGNVHAEVPDIGETAIAGSCTAGVAERVRLERAAPAIPKIVAVCEPKCMKLAANPKSMRQPEHRRREKILVVHHIVERKAGVRTRCGKNLKKGAMAAIDRIGVATAIAI